MTIEIAWTEGAAFRAARSGLSQPASDIAGAAAAILGVQSQIEAPSRWGLAMRTSGVPLAEAITDALLKQRSVIRAWGQRDTVHIYATDDWHLIAQAQRRWPVSSRTGTLPFTRTTMLDAAPGRLVDWFRANPVNNDPPERMAITRLIWAAGHEGYLSSVQMLGREQAYVARRVWIPDALWRTLDTDAACVEVVRRYLGTWAPARPHDIAHYLGARITDVRRWIHTLSDELLPVTFHDLDGHYILARDRDCFLPGAFPVAPARLLPAYDTQMMTHAWKDPLLANAEDRTRIWDKAAIVRPTILHNGQFVATWSHKVIGRKLRIEIEELTGRGTPAIRQAIAAAVEHDGAAFAAHMGTAIA
jgi:hypothetical protein